MKYQSLLNVTAFAIIGIGQRDQHGTLPLTLENETVVPAQMGMILAHEPTVGDYYVTGPDGNAWLMSAADFERKFQSSGIVTKSKSKKKGK